MVNRRVLLGSAGALLAEALLSTAQTAGGRKIVFEHDLPDLSLKGSSLTVVEVSYAPGETSNPHRNPGITIAYVLEGVGRWNVGDDPKKTYATGQMVLKHPYQL